MLVPSFRSIDGATQSHRHVQAAHLWNTQMQAQDAVATFRRNRDFDRDNKSVFGGVGSVLFGASAFVVVFGFIAITMQ